MHCVIYAAIPDGVPLEEGVVNCCVRDVMARFHYDYANEFAIDGFQVGGRWTGAFDGYDPERDESLMVRCDLCAGTGTRPDGLERFGQAWVDQMNGCNGCTGRGVKLLWPTQWPFRAGDVAPASEVLARIAAGDTKVPFGVVTAKEAVFLEEDHPFTRAQGPLSGAMEAMLAGLGDTRVAVVDCHV